MSETPLLPPSWEFRSTNPLASNSRTITAFRFWTDTFFNLIDSGALFDRELSHQHLQLLPIMGCCEVEHRSSGNNMRWPATEINALDSIDIDCFRHTGLLIQVPGVRPQMTIITYPLLVTIKLTVIGKIESDQRRKQPPISLRNLSPTEISLVTEYCIKII